MGASSMRGDGCSCYARSEGECCCDVDWTDPEVYELRERVKELEALLKEERYVIKVLQGRA